MTHHISIIRLLYHRVLPELVCHGSKAKCHEEVFSQSEHLINSVVLLDHFISNIKNICVIEGFNKFFNVTPNL